MENKSGYFKVFRKYFIDFVNVRVEFVVLFFVALLSRCAVLGHPFIYADEEFYLFVGGQILHGGLPFVDIWDRKPIGLFLLYAVFHLCGEWRLYAYQIAALLSAWWTACLIFNIARTIAPRWGAAFAGSLYLLWITGVHGEGGQSSIFYEVLVCWAVWLIVKHFPVLLKAERLRRTGGEVMVILGLSMQLKYTTLFEGVYLGCCLLWLGQRQKRSCGKILVDGTLWLSIALLPTVLVFVVYVMMGHGREWYFANVQSMLLRHTSIDLYNIKWFLFISTVLFIGMVGSWFLRPQQPMEKRWMYIFLLGWAAAAYVGYCVLKEFPKHYSIPLFPPFFVVMAVLWRKRIGVTWLTGMLILGAVRGYKAEKRDLRGPGLKELREVQALVASPVGCSFMFSGQSIILDVIPYCPLTIYPFPAHLSFESEKDALGVNPVKELQRILEKKPLYLFDSQCNDKSNENIQVRRVFNDYVHKAYKIIYKHPENSYESDILIYKRNSF